MPGTGDDFVKGTTEDELKKLLDEARKRSAKERKKDEPIRERFSKHANSYVQSVIESETDGDPYLQLKATILRSLQELMLMHSEYAQKRIKQENFEHALIWASDEGKLEAAKDLIGSVRIGDDDWMKI